MQTSRKIFKRYAWIFAFSMLSSALLWLLPFGSSQVGELPFRLRFLGWIQVVLGPTSLAYWDLRYNGFSDAVMWLIILILDLGVLGWGLYSPNSKLARFAGYVAVIVWVLVGNMFPMSGL
jgi:hypothetical protein